MQTSGERYGASVDQRGSIPNALTSVAIGLLRGTSKDFAKKERTAKSWEADEKDARTDGRSVPIGDKVWPLTFAVGSLPVISSRVDICV